MKKQINFNRFVTIRMKEFDHKKIMRICFKRKINRSIILREMIEIGIQSMLTKKSKTHEPGNEK